MCSFSWHRFEPQLAVVFNRDESRLRPVAEPPKVLQDQRTRFIMPKDPQGQGSWIAANEYGFVFVLLNDYLGLMKSEYELISRGLLIRTLANCMSWSEVLYTVEQWPLGQSQPFQLGVLTLTRQQFWHYDGVVSKLKAQSLPKSLFSSGHQDAKAIINRRREYMTTLSPRSVAELVHTFRGHHPSGGKGSSHDLVTGNCTSFCMHRDDAHTQSLSCIQVYTDKVTFEYWDGQPCEVDRPSKVSLALSTTNSR